MDFVDNLTAEPGTHVFHHTVVPMGVMLAGKSGDVRHQHSVRQAAEWVVNREGFFIIDVEARARDLVVLQGVDQRRLIDERTARRVEQLGVRFHQAAPIRPDQAAAPTAPAS